MRVVVFGATGGVGRYVVEAALDAGHHVRAVVRDPSSLRAESAVTWVHGDLLDADSITRAISGCDAVLWAVGATTNTPDQVALFEGAMRRLVTAMEALGVRRLVALSGAAVTLKGERKPPAGRVMSAIVHVLARHVVDAKQREYEVISASRLDWTLVRPPRVIEGGATGRWIAGDTLRGQRATQGDVAACMVEQLADSTSIGRAPFVSCA